ncbi:MAG TPA: hypothetical protein VF618_18905 [Thermoanaerobaculia bacterium]
MALVTSPKAAPIAIDGTTPLTPEQILEQLRALKLHIPEFGPLPTATSITLRRGANVDDALVQAGISAISASPALTGALGQDGESLRGERDDVSRWQDVEAELQMLHRGVAAANLIRRHRLGLTVLQAYQIARQLVRHQRHADLLPLVDNMRRLNRGGRRKSTTTPPPPPKPSVTTEQSS